MVAGWCRAFSDEERRGFNKVSDKFFGK